MRSRANILNVYYSSLTLLEHISNACADVSEKLQDKVIIVIGEIDYMACVT